MILTRKIRIIPTKEQEEIFIKSAGEFKSVENYKESREEAVSKSNSEKQKVLSVR